MSRWFRVYDDLVDDPKVQRLPPPLFKALINLWCLASQNDGLLPSNSVISFKLRIPESKVAVVVAGLTAAGLLDDDETGRHPHNWNGRQFKSDVSNDRVKRHRERERNVTPTVTATPPETEAETDTKQRQKNSEPKKVLRSLPSDWVPTENGWFFAASKDWPDKKIYEEIERFRNYCLSNGKRYRDFDAAWRNWVTSPYQKTTNGKPNGQSGKRSGSLLDALDRLEIGDGDTGGAVDILRLPPR